MLLLGMEKNGQMADLIGVSTAQAQRERVSAAQIKD